MNEPGAIRRAPDGTFEYLRSQRLSLWDGVTEVWEPVATHAAQQMTMPGSFFRALHEAGYRGGRTLYDLLVHEGWRPPDRGYIEITEGHRVLGPGE